jgi:5-formyltetrahydrofolate cyclo-ligase
MNKAELRQIYLDKQKSLARDERNRRSKRVVESLFANFDLSAWHFLSCFVTLEKNNEIDTFEIFGRLWREFPLLTTTAPRINFEMNVLENVRVTPASKFSENKWRILEPEGDELIEPIKLDAVLVPLIAFDKRGFRVGYGKGFYDKFLSKCRDDCRKIGLSLFPPVEKIADVEDFDVPLDACVTSEKIWKFK